MNTHGKVRGNLLSKFRALNVKHRKQEHSWTRVFRETNSHVEELKRISVN